MKNNLEGEGVKALRWVKASERPPDNAESGDRLSIKYNGKNETLIFLEDVWNFYQGNRHGVHYKVKPEEWKAIEWLEEYDLPQQVKALSAPEVLDKHITFKQAITDGRYSCTGIPYENALAAMEEYAQQSTKLSDQQIEIKVQKLIAAYENYIALWEDEVKSMSGLAYVHGWKSQNAEKGVKAREEIKAIKDLLTIHFLIQ